LRTQRQRLRALAGAACARPSATDPESASRSDVPDEDQRRIVGGIEDFDLVFVLKGERNGVKSINENGGDTVSSPAPPLRR
jgi:hypothetical protein